MAGYQALARKYRPRNFEEVVGQRPVVTALRNAIDAGRLHHAYLLTGTRGVGKTTIARILARCLECEDGVSSHPHREGGSCGICEAIARGSFPDVIEIDAASQTKVEDTRALLENTRYPPLRGRFKIYIVDEVHMLSASSFNALLKTLEEPPEYVKFILATTDPHKIPVTVLSRCLRFQLKALSADEIAGRIGEIAAAEKVPCESGAAVMLARAARGSLRDALSLCDQAAALGGGSITCGCVSDMLGTAGDGLIVNILNLLRPGTPADAGALLSEVRQLSPNYKNLLEELASCFHELALCQLVGHSRLNIFGLSPGILEEYARIFTPEQLQLYYQIALQGIEENAVFTDGAAAFEMMILRLLAFTPEKKKHGWVKT